MITKTRMTVHDFALMETSDTEDYELVDGELIPMSSGTPTHAKIRSRIERLLDEYLEAFASGETLVEVDCQINSDTVRRPDVSVFLGDQPSRIDRRRIPVSFAPAIAIEVISPTERALDVNRKVLDYLGAGTREVWLFDDVNGEIFVHTQEGIRLLHATDKLETPWLPGFTVNVAKLLA